MFDSPGSTENNQVQDDQRIRETPLRPMDPVVGLRPRLRRVVVAALAVIAVLAIAAGVVVATVGPSIWVAVGGALGWAAVLVGTIAAVQIAVRPVDEQLSTDRTARTNAERAAWENHWRAGATQATFDEFQRDLATATAQANHLLGDGVKELNLVAEQVRRGDAPSSQPAEVVLAGWPGGALGELEPAARQLVRTALAAATLTASHQPVGVLITLARRLQPLIHRSIKELDTLESQVEDPDLLNALFQLDHLVTRARRQAESIAVLGGATARQIRKPVGVYTVLRQAIAEIEHYERVKVLRPVPGTIVGHAVTEVIHLIAELLENATAFSPPDSRVQVQVDLVPDGLSIEIDDLGLVMAAEQRQRMNQLLSAPDRLDVAEQLKDGRIGLIVVAAIARRYQIRVRLERNERGGNRALVVLPAKVLSEEQPADAAAGRHAATGSQAPMMVPSHRAEPIDPGPATGRPDPGQARTAIPRGTAAVIQSLPPAPSGPAPGEPPADIPHRPALPRRDGQHMAPELRGNPRSDGSEPGGHDPGLLASYQRGRERADRAEPPTTP